MQKEQISYAELAKRVGDCVLFNNHNAHNEQWYETIYMQPLLVDALTSEDDETRAYMQEAIDRSTDEAEKAKLIEELQEWDEQGERASVLDAEIYQTYHITRSGAEYLLNHTSEMVSYDESLDAYLWHIQHWGTSWTHVHTTFYDYLDEKDHQYLDIEKVSYAY
jgi:hypothetical protein